MTTSPFYIFLDFVDHDQKIIHNRKHFSLLSQEKKAITDKVNASKFRVEAVKEKLLTLRKQHDRLELDLQAFTDKRQKKEDQLLQVKNQKDLLSVEREISTFHKEEEACEEKIIALWEQLEQVQYDLVHIQEKETKFQRECSKKLQDIQQQQDEIEEIYSQLVQQRKEKLEHIRPEWKKTYEMLQKQVNNPVVPISNGACSVCGTAITSQLQAQLARNAIKNCSSCYRMLYVL